MANVEGEVLCVGGPLDGEWVGCVGVEMKAFKHPERRGVLWPIPPWRYDEPFGEIVRYHLVSVGDSEGTPIRLYALVGDGMRPIARLVAGYRPAQKPDG